MRDSKQMAAGSSWGPPRRSIEAECARRGTHAVIAGCVQLIGGDDADTKLIIALGGPHARYLLHTGPSPDQRYWLRVWAARGLLWVWEDGALDAIRLALGDPAWRVREMALKVTARHQLGELLETAVQLREDPLPRVRAAAVR